jgi:tetratricopeptide (TPR) repeat protein
LFVFSGVILSFQLAVAQSESSDSLKQLLKSTKNDTLKIQLMSEIAEIDNVIRLSYWDSIINLSRKFNLPKIKSHALNNIGYIFWNQGDVATSLKYFHLSLKISEEKGYDENMASALSNIGVVYDGQADYTSALEYYNKSLDLLQKSNGDKNLLATVLNNIAGIYNNQRNFSKALKYYTRSLAIRKQTNDLAGIANSLNNIGNVYYIYKDDNQKDNLDIALNYLNQSLAISEQIGDKYEAAFSLNTLSDIYFKKNDFEKAQMFAQKAMKNAQEIEYPESISEAANELRNIYKKQNKYKEAYEMYELFIQMRDSISNQETKKTAIKQQLKYDYEKKASADSVRTAKEKEVVAVQLKQEKTQRYALYGGLILTIVFGGFMIKRVRLTQRQKKLIEEQKMTVETQKDLMEIKQKEILDSIHYAKRIQQSLMPTEKYIHKSIKRLKNKP